MKNLLNIITETLSSKRFLSFYRRSFGMVCGGFLDLVLLQLTEWDSKSMITIVAGLIIGEITKKLNTK